SRPNGKMIVDSIENGSYVRRMIATPGELDLRVPVPESLHEQTDEELTETDIKIDKFRMLEEMARISLDSATTAEDWAILLGTAQPCQGKGMLLIFRLSDLDEIEEVNANYILMANLQQASTSDKFLDKEADLEARIKDLENIMLKRDQTVQTMHMLNPKPDSFYHPNQKMALCYQNPSYLKKAPQKQQSLYNGNLLLKEHDPPTVYDSEETLEHAQESRKKMRLLKKEIKPANYAKINHLS
nr:hypothetical protein [Tanacetum cinerariifolium]